MAGGVGYTPNAGDWIVAGIWAKGLAQTNSFVTGCPGNPSTTYSYTYNNYGMIVGDGQWQYLWIAEKVASGSATTVCDLVYFTNTVTPTLYGPTLYVIPAGTLSDNEVLEFANTMNSVDSVLSSWLNLQCGRSSNRRFLLPDIVKLQFSRFSSEV